MPFVDYRFREWIMKVWMLHLSRRTAIALSMFLSMGLAGSSMFEARAEAEEPKLASGIDKEHISRTLSPGSDFYEYVNEGWLKSTEIPPDRSNYGAFTALEDDTLDAVRAIIDEAAADTDAPLGSDRQKVGDFYRSFTNI